MAVKKKPVSKKVSLKEKLVLKPAGVIHAKAVRFMRRRPHRSFRLTKKRDYNRSLNLPGYFAFTKEVRQLLWKNKKLFLVMMVVYSILTAIFVGIASQSNYATLTATLQSTGSQIFTGNFGQLGQAGLLFLATISGSSSTSLSDVQQIYAALLGLLTWLTTVWLLRNILAGYKVRLRDGLYNAGAPIVSTFIVLIVMIIQLLPIAIAAIGYEAASTTGLLNSGVEAMTFWIAAGFLTILSLYWITSTLIGLVVVTLPGMYPFEALKVAGDMVIGRRVRILLRIVWMLVGLALVWVVVMIPVILIDTWLKGVFAQLEAMPTIPILLLILSSFSIVWIASYVYLLYRKVVEDDALPA